MKKIFAILLAVTLMLSLSVTVFAAETATITLELTDSYGDGWETTSVKACLVKSDGSEEVLQAGMTVAEDEATYELTVNKYAVVRFYWEASEDYDDECGVTVKRNGNIQFEQVDFHGMAEGDLIFESSDYDPRFTAVTYSVDPTYTVTSPATVALGEDVTISADNVVVKKGQQVEVSLTDANGFAVTSAEGAELIYTVKNGDTAVAEGDTVLAVNPDNGKTGSTTLTFVAPTEYTYSGDYTGTVTFTVAVKDVPTISFKFYENGANYWSGDGEDYVVYTVLEGTTWGEWLASEDNVYNLTDGENCIYAPGPAFLEHSDKETGSSDWPLVDDEIVADAVYGLGRY